MAMSEYRTMVTSAEKMYNVEFFTGTEIVHLYERAYWLFSRTIVENVARTLAEYSEERGLGYTVRVISQSA